MSLERALCTILTNGEAVSSENIKGIEERLRTVFGEAFLRRHFSIYAPVPDDRIETAFDVLEVKVTLLAFGLHRYKKHEDDICEEADTDVIEAKQCLECGSMNTIAAGSGAGVCNVCGCWIPDYESAKRLTGESQ